MRNLKKRVYNLIRDDDDNNRAADIFDGAIIALILLNVLLLILNSFPIPAWFRTVSEGIESFSVGVFTVEYAARLWTSTLRYPELPPWKARLRFATRFMSVVDLVAILPFYIPVVFPLDLRVLRLLRVIRLLRLFKVNRYIHALDTITEVFRRKASQLVSSLFAVLLLATISSVLMYGLENAAQPGVFANAFDGLWWTLATLTSANYGDIYPVTLAGRLLSGLIALLGIGLIAVPTGIISAGFVEVMGENTAGGNPDTALPTDEQLRRYKALADEGVITGQEYAALKSRLLALASAERMEKTK